MRFTGKMLSKYVHNYNKYADDKYPRIELYVFNGMYHIWTLDEQWRIADEVKPIDALHKLQIFVDGIRYFTEIHRI